MSRVGRKPKPTHLKLIKGSLRSPYNKNEPKPPRAKPKPPDWMDDYAKEYWSSIIDELYAVGCMTNLDAGPLSSICQAYSLMRRAFDELQHSIKVEGGLAITTKQGNIVQNPLLGAYNKASTNYMRFCVEFGLTPSSRSRISVGDQPHDSEQDKAESYFD